MVLFSLFSFLFAPAIAVADDCADLGTAIPEASPHEAAPMFVQYAACAPADARAAAAEVLPGLLAGESGHDAAVAAIRVGAGVDARSWIVGLMSDERAPAIRAVGKACGEDPSVQAFFVDTAAALGDEFWSQRWYRGLAKCRVALIKQLLTERVDAGMGDDRGQYFSVVQAWASNVAAGSLPKLAEMITLATETEVKINLIQAFSDAAQVGSIDGMDVKVADAAARTIVALAPTLPAKAVEQGRITLQSLDHEQEADGLSLVRYKDLLQKDDTLLYGVVVVETATCKNGKVSQRVHVAEAVDPGQTWPDQLTDKVQATAEHSWNLNLAERCKGEGKTEVKVPDAPFADKPAFRKWVEAQIEEATDADVKKPVRMDHDPIEF
jgi:hypothetical protein